jgi:hypothetical protein
MNETILQFAQWLDAFDSSTGLHESLYLYPWIESTHVLALMVSLGMLVVIDLRMLGLFLTDVPASKIAAKLNVPMMIGFAVMIVTGLILFYAIPVRTAQSIWFRIKFLLLIAAAINAWLFHKKMRESVSTWDRDAKPPPRIRVGAGLSITLWIGVVITGRGIAYNMFDCGNSSNSDLLNTLAGCIE